MLYNAEYKLKSTEELGYAYAIMKWSAKSAVDLYKKCAVATMIDEESSEIDKRMIKMDE